MSTSFGGHTTALRLFRARAAAWGKLPALRRLGLDQLNISLDTLDQHKFTLIARRKGAPLLCGRQAGRRPRRI